MTTAVLPENNNDRATQVRDDGELLLAIAQHGDHSAYNALFERYSREAYNWALQITHNPTLSEEAVQDAMLYIWLHADQFDYRNHPRGWIYRIVINRCLALVRSSKRRSKREEIKCTLEAPSTEQPSSPIEKQELLSKVGEQLFQLPEVERQVIVLHFGGGLKHREISEVLGISRIKVVRKIRVALDRLRSDLMAAGFGAAVPLLTEEGLGAVLGSRRALPAGLQDQVAAKIAQAEAGGTDPFRHSQHRLAKATATTSKAVWTILGLGGLAFALGSGFMLWKSSAGPQSGLLLEAKSVAPPTPFTQAQSKSSPEDNVSGEAPFHLKWDFKTAAAKDFKVGPSEWVWDSGHGMTVATDAHPVLPVKLPPRPLLLTLTLNLLPTVAKGPSPQDLYIGLNVRWCDGEKSPAMRSVKRNVSSPLNSTFVAQVYMIGSYIVIFLPEGHIGSVAEYQRPYPCEQLMLTLNALQLQELEVRALKPYEISGLKAPEKLRQEIGSAPEDLPELLLHSPKSIKP